MKFGRFWRSKVTPEVLDCNSKGEVPLSVYRQWTPAIGISEEELTELQAEVIQIIFDSLRQHPEQWKFSYYTARNALHDLEVWLENRYYGTKVRAKTIVIQHNTSRKEHHLWRRQLVLLCDAIVLARLKTELAAEEKRYMIEHERIPEGDRPVPQPTVSPSERGSVEIGDAMQGGAPQPMPTPPETE